MSDVGMFIQTFNKMSFRIFCVFIYGSEPRYGYCTEVALDVNGL